MTRNQLKLSISAASACLVAIGTSPAARAEDGAFPLRPADRAAAAEAKRSALHPRLANTPAAAAYPRDALRAAGPTTNPFQNGRPRYPGDLSYQGGQVVENVQSHAIFVTNRAVNCTTPACWGNPEAFLQNLSGSDFIHVTDQYVGRHDDGRYSVGSHVSGTLSPYPTTPLTDSDMLSIVHFVAGSITHQTGYDHIYHIFLAPGTDECFTSALTTCYSPDKPSTFFFCAYHSSVDFSDIGHVLYSVEPFQNVGGCNVAPGSPNGQLVDSTASVLSHELIEAITDPDGDAWWNTASNGLFGEEIADECSFVIFLPSGVYFDPPAFNIGGKRYAVQSEYSNSGHACVTSGGN